MRESRTGKGFRDVRQLGLLGAEKFLPHWGIEKKPADLHGRSGRAAAGDHLTFGATCDGQLVTGVRVAWSAAE